MHFLHVFLVEEIGKTPMLESLYSGIWESLSQLKINDRRRWKRFSNEQMSSNKQPEQHDNCQ